MQNCLYLIPLFPLLGFLINGLFSRFFGEKTIGTIASALVFASFAAAVAAFFELLALPEHERLQTQALYQWMSTGAFSIDLSLRFDALSALMALVVTGVAFLIHVYSIGYMHGERGYGRFFAFLNLFTFMMLMLVLGDNFLVMFLGWEGVGLCSYLLIGYYYDRLFDEETGLTCAQAGKKAFIVNRVGDFGFLLGMFLIFATFGSFDFDQVFSQASSGMNPAIATAVCLLLFVGATGKSAQLPLYVWLPDAMAGPTPVSALIHAATMVTAGVYMVARCSVLYVQSPVAMSVVAIVGVATALFAATIALTSSDIKKVLAYSTISQLGYMFLACGVGAFAAGIFHLMTHAFFKALLFLGAGSVMHGLAGETRLEKMGGLKKHMPITARTFLIGGLALSGIPLFSGFFSKDEILWKAFDNPQGSKILWAVGLVAAGLTAFYVFRMIFLTFYGHARYAYETVPHVHESPPVMTVPLIILAVLSTLGGLIGVPHAFNKIEEYLHPVFAFAGAAAETHGELSVELGLMALSVIVAALGIYVASQMYLRKPQTAEALARSLRPLYQLLRKKYYVDEIYDALFVTPLHWLSENFFWKIFDVRMIDGLVNGAAKFFGGLSSGLRRLHTGVVQTYALSIMVGILAILGYLLTR